MKAKSRWFGKVGILMLAGVAGGLLGRMQAPLAICTALSAQKWVCNGAGHPMYWPIDDNRSEAPRSTQWFVEDVIKYHRTIETYVNGILDAGFRLMELREPAQILQASSAHPDLGRHRRRPPFLLLPAE